MIHPDQRKMAVTYPSEEQGDDGPDDFPVDNEQLSPASSSSLFETLPAEIIQCIASYLPPPDLACLGVTCRSLADHASNDLLWANFVNERLPVPIQDPSPFASFRRLYLAYHPCWFIPQHKIWFADNEHTGTLIIARYDDRRGVIEAYRVVAERGAPKFQIWMSNPEVMIQSFNPDVHLWLDDPILFLKDPDPSSRAAPIQYFHSMSDERRMPMALEAHHVYNTLSFCSISSPEGLEITPDMLWPPRTIPSNVRTVCASRDSPLPVPEQLSDLSELCFRIRKWANFRLMFSPVPNESIITYSTLDPVLYTPTEQKPYQGIWVGDYSAHGCEFLLILQKDTVPLARGNGKKSATSAKKEIEPDFEEELGQRGRLEAIKLTGDPNVPRGQFSFIAKDIGSRGLVSIATDEPFAGARIVRCRGQVAGLGFHDDTFIDSQLILISSDHMAHYWKEMGHVSYYRRVDIDALLHT